MVEAAQTVHAGGDVLTTSLIVTGILVGITLLVWGIAMTGTLCC